MRRLYSIHGLKVFGCLICWILCQPTFKCIYITSVREQMLATENIDSRLGNLEKGVTALDARVGEIDNKLGHVILLNQEMMLNNNDNFRHMHSVLEESKDTLQKSINKIKSQYTSKFQLYLFGFILAIWTFFVAFILLS